MKICPTSYVIKELQIKITVRYYYTAIRIAQINTDNTKCRQGCAATGTLIHSTGDAKS